MTEARPFGTFGDVSVVLAEDYVATAEIHRAPDNYFDRKLIAAIAEALEALDAEAACRVVVLCSEGKHFCAGANFRDAEPLATDDGRHLYDEAVRLFRTRKPILAVVQGAAVGGGLGLALAADLRTAAPEARFSANFARLGIHHGFGLGVTLPRVVGRQRALELLFTGRRVPGEEALAIGLCDRLVPLSELRAGAHRVAAEVASASPLAIEAIRATLRLGLADEIARATAHERAEQERLQRTDDFREGVRAMSERRVPRFARR